MSDSIEISWESATQVWEKILQSDIKKILFNQTVDVEQLFSILDSRFFLVKSTKELRACFSTYGTKDDVWGVDSIIPNILLIAFKLQPELIGFYRNGLLYFLSEKEAHDSFIYISDDPIDTKKAINTIKKRGIIKWGDEEKDR